MRFCTRRVAPLFHSLRWRSEVSLKSKRHAETLRSVSDAVGDWFTLDAGPALDVLQAVDENVVLIPQLLELIERHPEADFGTPGPIVSFIERYPRSVYLPFLEQSLLREPNHYNVWMASRLANLGEPIPSLLNALEVSKASVTEDDLVQDLEDVMRRLREVRN